MSKDYSINLEKHETKDIHDNHVNGSLTVIWRDWDEIIKNHPKMIYVSSVDSGEIKGPHIHTKRESYFTCIHGKVIFVIKKPDGTYEEILSSDEKPVMVHVPKNTKLDLPLRNIFRTTGQGGVFSHSIIILEEGAEITYVEEHYSEKYIGDTLRNDVVEIYAKKNSKINFINFQNWNDNVINITNWKGKIDQDAQINFYSGQFGGKLSRIKTDVMMNGLNSSSKNKSVFFANNNQHFDITTNIDHNVKHTTGDTLVKGVLDDSATSVFRGMIKIIDDAQHTDSYLSNHSLILSNNAVSNSIPSLQIDADEVRASHGATIGKPDEE